MAMRRKVIAGAAAALAVGGAGAGIAATKLASSPSAESKAVVSDAAKSLGIEPQKLSAALKKAMEDRVDAAVAAGRLTKAQGEEMKQRIAADDFPLFGPPAGGPEFHGGPHAFFHGLSGAGTYLGLTEAQLRARVNSGKTLAEIAKAQGKSVDGLKAALRKEEQTELDAAAKAGRLTKADEQRILADVDQRIDALVNGTLRERFRDHREFRGGFDRQLPPSSLPAA
jgi:hypothetical protein